MTRCIEMLCELVDYLAANDVFPGVEVKAGVCYFLWGAIHDGDCKVTILAPKPMESRR